MLLPVNAQNVTPPPAVTPTPVPAPTPTAPVPNLQYLPQKSYIQTFVPEQGVPLAQPATSLPQYTNQSSTGPFDMQTILSIVSLLAGGGALVKSKLVGDKTNKVEEVSREQSQQIIKGAEVDKSIADQVYKNMTDGGANIKDKPEIKLETLTANKDEAVKTASKA